MEKTYHWDYDKYHFELFVNNNGYRWDNEGTIILQPVKLTVNGYILLDNNWGIQHNLEFILGDSKNDSGMNNTRFTNDKAATMYIDNNKINFSVDGCLNSPYIVL